MRLPERLLLIGLPLTILFGFGAGVLVFPGVNLFEIAVLPTMLAPTDAALGRAVVTNPAVPAALRFGPRGLANVVFAVIVLNQNLPSGHELALTVACTVCLSILAHGFSANPLAASLGAGDVQELNDIRERVPGNSRRWKCFQTSRWVLRSYF
ncbi:MAG: hypothetical protein ACM3KE_04665 [Hyphomicrobiales bacterium]